jgi:catechol 2,3-dioxygenase-like lactoylglutathione lyase family enzyme
MGRRREGVLDIAIGHRDEGGDIGGEVAVAARRRSREHHQAFVKKIEAEGIKLDEPPRKSPTGSTITYITDPWGTRIELVQRATATQ